VPAFFLVLAKIKVLAALMMRGICEKVKDSMGCMQRFAPDVQMHA